MLTMCFFENFEVCIFIFGHFINVHFSKQPINNVPLPNNSNTYWFSYLKKLGGWDATQKTGKIDYVF